MIYGDKKTGILVQGATGKQGEFHIGLMNSYAREVGGRGVVAGVTPGKGGQQRGGPQGGRMMPGRGGQQVPGQTGPNTAPSTPSTPTAPNTQGNATPQALQQG